MLQIIAGSWPLAVMFIAALGALQGLRVMSLVQKNREEDRAYRASQAVTVRRADSAGMILIALCAASLLLSAGGAVAADKPVPPLQHIGAPIGATKPEKRETDEQYIRRVSKPAPGKLE